MSGKWWRITQKWFRSNQLRNEWDRANFVISVGGVKRLKSGSDALAGPEAPARLKRWVWNSFYRPKNTHFFLPCMLYFWWTISLWSAQKASSSSVRYMRSRAAEKYFYFFVYFFTFSVKVFAHLFVTCLGSIPPRCCKQSKLRERETTLSGEYCIAPWT